MLALLAKAEFPKVPLDLQHQVGWLALLALVLVAVWAWTRAESVRRAIFAREDPRLFALFRIGLGLITIQNFWNLLMHWRMLWTDEGLFTRDEVRQRIGRSALVGWTEVDGFLDGWAVLKFFWGKFSLLYFDSSPAFVQVYLAILFGVLVLYTIGFRTRVTAWVALLLIFSLYNRNAVYLEGHDTVFKNLWFVMVFAKADAAWSVDNWLRVRRERRYRALVEGRGAEQAVPLDTLKFVDRASLWLWGGLWAWLFCAKVDFTTRHVNLVVIGGILLSFILAWLERERRQAEASRGTLELAEPVRFERVPGWPRYLIIAQLICIYWATGLYKTGDIWKRGDALYYALNMDHFYRFEGATQWVSVYLATNVFRVMSLITWWWEKLFPLVAIGLILGFGLRFRETAWYRAQNSVVWRRWLGRAALLGAYLVVYRTMIVAYPWCLELQKGGVPTPAGPGLANLHLWFAAIVPSCVAIYFVLGRWPLRLPKPAWRARLRAQPIRPRTDRFVIDQEFVRAWLFGRRIWLTVGLLFHGMLLTTMNIGMFPVIMMWTYVAYFEARPFLKIFRWFAGVLRRWRVTAWLAPKLLDSAYSEEPGVLETAEQSLRRDGAGPWWFNPWTLLVGPILVLRRRKREALLEVAEGGRTRGGMIPDLVVLGLGAVVVLLVTLRGLEAETRPDAAIDTDFVSDVRAVDAEREHKRAVAEARTRRIDRLGTAARWWGYSLVAVALVCHFRRRRPCDLAPGDLAPGDLAPGDLASGDLAAQGSAEPPAEPAVIGGTLMRTVVLAFIVFHCGAVAVEFTPDYPITQAWRSAIKKPFGEWVRATNQTQSWKMFAPNPPQGNTFMRTVVVDHDDEPYQVGKDHYSNRPYVFWYNDRMRKMHRRMVGNSKWYLRFWAQYHCRDWAFNHDGQLPKEVRVFKLRTPIPRPDDLAKAGVPSDPRARKLRSEHLETHACKDDMITPEHKLRRGWPLSEADQRLLDREPERWEINAENRRKSWEKREDFGKTKKKTP
jgi:hypothetical protein